MRIIDVTSDQGEDGKIPFSVTIRKILSEGFCWQAELDARDQVTHQLSGVLGPEFTLLRGVVLPGLDAPIPLVLLGPPGIFVLFVSALKGTFRARGDVWLALDTSGNMHPAKPNLPTRARLFSEAIRKFLIKHSLPVGEIESVLVFARNDAFVENIKAPIRIVLADGIENYASSLRLSQPALPPEQIAPIVRLLAGSKDRPDAADPANLNAGILAQAVVMPSAAGSLVLPEAVQGTPLREIFTDQSMARQIAIPDAQALPEQDDTAESGIAALLHQAHLSKRQAVFLIVFTILDSCVIIILLSLAIYLLRSQ
jgi:hypothetical protein